MLLIEACNIFMMGSRSSICQTFGSDTVQNLCGIVKS